MPWSVRGPSAHRSVLWPSHRRSGAFSALVFIHSTSLSNKDYIIILYWATLALGLKLAAFIKSSRFRVKDDQGLLFKARRCRVCLSCFPYPCQNSFWVVYVKLTLLKVCGNSFERFICHGKLIYLTSISFRFVSQERLTNRNEIRILTVRNVSAHLKVKFGY